MTTKPDARATLLRVARGTENYGALVLAVSLDAESARTRAESWRRLSERFTAEASRFDGDRRRQREQLAGACGHMATLWASIEVASTGEP